MCLCQASAILDYYGYESLVLIADLSAILNSPSSSNDGISYDFLTNYRGSGPPWIQGTDAFSLFFLWPSLDVTWWMSGLVKSASTSSLWGHPYSWAAKIGHDSSHGWNFAHWRWQLSHYKEPSSFFICQTRTSRLSDGQQVGSVDVLVWILAQTRYR